MMCHFETRFHLTFNQFGTALHLPPCFLALCKSLLLIALCFLLNRPCSVSITVTAEVGTAASYVPLDDGLVEEGVALRSPLVGSLKSLGPINICNARFSILQ